MAEKLLVKIPIDNRFWSIDDEQIERLIVENQSKFWPLFQRIIDIDDARVGLVDDSLEVQHMDIEKDRRSGSAEVNFMSSFYAGCKNLNSDDWHTASLPFEITQDALVFKLDLPIRWYVDN